MNRTRLTGFTLIDLLFTIGILSILLGVALPSFNEFLKKQKIMAVTAQLRGALQVARNLAIIERKKITICPSNDAKTCSDEWSNGYLVFIDINNNREVNDGETIIFNTHLDSEDIQLSWKAFGVRSSFQWHETGITSQQNGTFQLCLNHNPKFARALIIAKAGRIRISTDENKDGIHEDASGKNINCA